MVEFLIGTFIRVPFCSNMTQKMLIEGVLSAYMMSL